MLRQETVVFYCWCDPRKLHGWPASRTRQFLLGQLRGLHLEIIEFHPFTTCAAMIESHCKRAASDSFTVDGFKIASELELQTERRWALSRPHVIHELHEKSTFW